MSACRLSAYLGKGVGRRKRVRGKQYLCSKRQKAAWPGDMMSLLPEKYSQEVGSCLTARKWALLSKQEVLGQQVVGSPTGSVPVFLPIFRLSSYLPGAGAYALRDPSLPPPGPEKLPSLEHRDSPRPRGPPSARPKMLVISGGDGYEDFRLSSGGGGSSETVGRDDSTNHLLLWRV